MSDDFRDGRWAALRAVLGALAIAASGSAFVWPSAAQTGTPAHAVDDDSAVRGRLLTPDSSGASLAGLRVVLRTVTRADSVDVDPAGYFTIAAPVPAEGAELVIDDAHPQGRRYHPMVVRIRPREARSGVHVALVPTRWTIDRGTYGYTDVPGDREAMRRYVERLVDDHANARVLPFAQRRLDTGELAGCTRFMEPRWWRYRTDPDEIEIGGTWLASTAQRTAVNTEAKYLLLSHAFEQWDVWRVAICTDEDNARSRVAIERLGASFEGVLRNHRLRYNTAAPEPRNTAVYSIIDADWPAVKQSLEQRLAGIR